MVFFLDIYV